jgi:hypothetical protein
MDVELAATHWEISNLKPRRIGLKGSGKHEVL